VSLVYCLFQVFRPFYFVDAPFFNDSLECDFQLDFFCDGSLSRGQVEMLLGPFCKVRQARIFFFSFLICQALPCLTLS